jgi:hypothetical protein
LYFESAAFKICVFKYTFNLFARPN